MKTNKLLYNYLLSLVVAIALFTLLLLIPIPYSFTAFFWYYSPLLFFIVFTIYALSFQLDNYWGWLLGLGVTMVLFALALSYMWNSGYSDNKVIGGILPYRDAYHYYNGARLMLDGRTLPEYTVQAAGRPLFPGFIASLLLLTGKNLQISIAVLVGLMGFTSYLSAHNLRAAFGPLPAALYISFSFLYAQSQIGFLHTELLGLILGNLGFILIWQSAQQRNLKKLIFAIFILMTAVSARAGAFLIFPMLAFWAGWVFRGEAPFSWRSFGIISLVVILSYLSVNTLYSRIFVEPGSYTFGNFAYTLYGQIHGGTGWNRAIQDLATRDPVIIMDSAIQFFKAHPTSLLIGIAKSYRDFFIRGDMGIFSFFGSKTIWLDLTLWISSVILLIIGLLRTIKNIKNPISSLILAGFIGIFLSIPFLPPIDGGRRFYASTMPFFFALIALTLSSTKKEEIKVISDKQIVTAPLAGLIALMTIIMPFFILQFTTTPEIASPSCPVNQVPYAIRLDPNSYLDIAPEQEIHCGNVPYICFDDFSQNSTEKKTNLLYQELVNQARLEEGTLRILVANNLVPRKSLHFFISPADLLTLIPPRTIISGCATKLIIKSFPTIYKIESVAFP
ncbi:MAG: hypothetical protein HQ525_01705 [Anaerolineae bacterium]|nr:hypothetical protein [Anaerolineae bacterium]